MALSVTIDDRLNNHPTIQEGLARGLGFAVGTMDLTYSSAGGLSWTGPFTHTVYCSIPPVSQYIFSYNVTTGMLAAYQTVVTTTALASTLVEVASDTDFTALTDALRFVAFGF